MPSPRPLAKKTIAASGGSPAIIGVADGLAFVTYTNGGQVYATILGP